MYAHIHCFQSISPAKQQYSYLDIHSPDAFLSSMSVLPGDVTVIQPGDVTVLLPGDATVLLVGKASLCTQCTVTELLCNTPKRSFSYSIEQKCVTGKSRNPGQSHEMDLREKAYPR